MIKHRDGSIADYSNGQNKLLGMLYGSAAGRLLLRPLISPAVSRAAGKLLSSGLSRILISPFIRQNHIDMDQYEAVRYRSYNEFFARKIRSELRPIDKNAHHLISPCDSKLTVMKITDNCRFRLKHTEYTIDRLLQNELLAARYRNGYALIFRLTVDDYHRYCYICDGRKGENIHIPGVLHTVNPIANDHYPIYKENTREYSILHSDVFGDVLMMEVGALLVGRIVNHHEQAAVVRGQEKGFFQFGGSTVVLLFQSDKVVIDKDILRNSLENIETIVHMGEKIGTSAIH